MSMSIQTLVETAFEATMTPIEQHDDNHVEALVEAVFSALHMNPAGPVLVRSMEAQAESQLGSGTQICFSDIHNGERFVLAHYAGFIWRINVKITLNFHTFSIWDVVSIWRSEY